MFVPSKIKTSVQAVALALALGATSFSANAVLERVGPLNTAPSVGGFPAWYMDTTGIALDFCDPKSALEVAGAWCVVTTAEVPTVPEVYPTNFFDEHFYTRIGATLATPAGAKAILDLSIEAVAQNVPAPGGNITFARIRMKLLPIPVSGTYKFIHPFGEESLEGTAGDRIFFSDDVGIGSPGDFTGAMTSRFGPFLLPSLSPGGAEQAAVAGPGGRLYIADPGRLGPVTGSSLPNFTDSTGASRNHNIFRIEGPLGSNLGGTGIDFIETTDFALMGRLFNGPINSLVTTDRASYARTTLDDQKVDVYATAFPTAAARAPAGPRPAGVQPVMSFFNVPCGATFDAAGKFIEYTLPVGGVESLMAAQGNARWGQFLVAPGGTLPDSVCVKDNSAVGPQGQQIPAYNQMAVNDVVKVTQALYDPAAKTLAVQATSSDLFVPPTLTLAGVNQPLVGGAFTVTAVNAPPSKVEVLSSARGSDIEAVSTALASVGAGAGVAGNVSVTTLEDSGAVSIPVTLNGAAIDPAASTVAIIGSGSKGVAVANAGAVTYTPNANANGVDTFSYTVTTGGATSNVATVTVNITAVNDAPVANNDTAVGAINVPLVINVLANDSDVDGDALAIVSVTAPTGPAGSTSSATANANGTVTFNASAGGNYTFSYSVTDGTLASNTAQVTVSVAGAETVRVTAADYTINKSRWNITGTTSINPAHTMTAKLTGVVGTPAVPCNADGRVIGSVQSAGGTYTIQATGTVDPRTTNCNRVIVDSPLGGVSPNFTFRLR